MGWEWWVTDEICSYEFQVVFRVHGVVPSPHKADNTCNVRWQEGVCGMERVITATDILRVVQPSTWYTCVAQRHRWKLKRRPSSNGPRKCKQTEKTNKMQQMFIFNNISTCFGHHYAHLQENKTCYCMWCAALVLLDVVGSGCGALPCGLWALWRLLFDYLHSAHTLQGSAPQPLPTTSSRTSTAHHMQ